MIEQHHIAGLVVECRKLDSEWGGHAWRPVTVFPVPPEVAPWTPLGSSAAGRRYYAGPVGIAFYSTDTANYIDNLNSGEPRLWVVMRAEGPEPPLDIVCVTADPAEGEGNSESGSNIVETVAMPPEIAAALAEFVVAHHVERPIIKRKRDRAEPELKWRPGEGPQAKPGHGEGRE